MLAWLAKESGGNPCALGIPGVEAGIFQTFHPADDRFGATFSQLRSACSGGKLNRPLTSDEAVLQAKVGVNFIRNKVAVASAHFAAAGIKFPKSSKDFWIGVKQEHALPCVMAILPRVTAKLGRPPRSWSEIHQTLMRMSQSELAGGCDRFAASPSVRGLKNRLEDTLVNAEEVGQFGGGLFGTTGTVLKIALVGAFAYGAYRLLAPPATAAGSTP